MTDPISRWFAGRAGSQGAVMLMYHAIVPGKGAPAWPWAISLDAFRAQLDLLSATGWRTETMARLAGGSVPADQRTVVITFDDGFANNLAAVNELAKRRMCASWFIVTGSIGQSPGWQSPARPPGRLLNASELRGMCRLGMEIGSHTISHHRLSTLDAACVAVELRDSREHLEDLLGERITSFAYPYGDHSDSVVQAVRDAGYLAACTTRTGWAMRDGDPLRLRRLTVFNHDGASTLARKLFFGSHEVRWPKVGRYFARRLIARFGA